MKLLTQLRKERQQINTECKRKVANIANWSKLLPKDLTSYDWKDISISNYPSMTSTFSFTTLKEDALNTATATAWLISLFDDIKIEKPQMSRWNTMPYIRAIAKLSNGEDICIYIYLYRTGQCKKVKITKQIPEEIVEAHVEEEYTIVCAGEEMPENAELVEEL